MTKHPVAPVPEVPCIDPSYLPRSYFDPLSLTRLMLAFELVHVVRRLLEE